MDFYSATCKENIGFFKKEKRRSRLTATETEQTLHRKKAGFFMEKRQAKMSEGWKNLSPKGN